MKKQLLILTAAIPLSCLASCGQQTTSEVVRYRDNFTSGKLYRNGQLSESRDVEYDDRGLPIKEIDKSYVEPLDGNSVTEKNTYKYSREFDKNNHEIKHHETATSDNINGEATSVCEYDDDFLTRETIHVERTETFQYGSEKTVSDMWTTHNKTTIGKSNYSLLIDEGYHEAFTTDIESNGSTIANYEYHLRFTTFDKLDRMTLQLEFIVLQNAIIDDNNTYFASDPDITISLDFAYFLSEQNNTNIYTNLTARIDPRDEAPYLKINTLGYKIYSDMNHVLSAQQINNLATFTPSSSIPNPPVPQPRSFLSALYQYDELNRISQIEETRITSAIPRIIVCDFTNILPSFKDIVNSLVYDDNEISMIDTSISTYTYNGNSKNPSELKNVVHGENLIRDTSYDRVATTKYDDYRRVLSNDSITTNRDGETTITNTMKTAYTYADPIVIPKNEILIARIL